MKCLHCDNQLPGHRPWATTEKPSSGRLACMQYGCISYNLNPRTKIFAELVLGRSAAEIEARAKAKARKGSATKRKAGYYDDSSNNPYSKAFWQKRGLSEEEAAKKVHGRMVTKPEYWESRSFTAEDAALEANRRAKTNSLEFKKTKYGAEEGTRRYEQYCALKKEQWSERSAQGLTGKRSVVADRMFLKIYRYLRRRGFVRNDFMMEMNRGEMWIRTDENIYFYDFVVRPLKLIIEFNGSHVHPSPSMTEAQRAMWRHAFSKETAEDVEKRERVKYELAESEGYTIIHVWDFDSSFEHLKPLLEKEIEK